MSCNHIGKGERRDFDKCVTSSVKQFDGFNDDGTQKEVEIATTVNHYKIRCAECGSDIREDADWSSVRF